MGFPRHPETIILKNEFYPRGLREIDTYGYYQLNKDKILREVAGRDLMFYIAVDTNKFIIKRAGKETQYIRLTASNWDDEVHGRVISIHSAMRKMEDIAVVDIDTDNFGKAKKAVLDVYKILLGRVPIVNKVQIRFTGKKGFHLFCTLKKKMSIDSIRMVLKKVLSTSPELQNYTIEQSAAPGMVNLDLAPNKFRGNFITLHALSTWGLKCMPVPIGRVTSFNQKDAIIKTLPIQKLMKMLK